VRSKWTISSLLTCPKPKPSASAVARCNESDPEESCRRRLFGLDRGWTPSMPAWRVARRRGRGLRYGANFECGGRDASLGSAEPIIQVAWKGGVMLARALPQARHPPPSEANACGKDAAICVRPKQP
jgi:hypothetical protein